MYCTCTAVLQLYVVPWYYRIVYRCVTSTAVRSLPYPTKVLGRDRLALAASDDVAALATAPVRALHLSDWTDCRADLPSARARLGFRFRTWQLEERAVFTNILLLKPKSRSRF